jgi:hypothetical protein
MPRQDYFDWLESVNQCDGSDSDSVILLFVFLPLIRAEIFRWVDIHNEHKWAPLNFAPIFTFKNEWTCVILLVRSLIMESRFHAFPGREQEICDQLLVGARKETPDVWLCRAPPAQKKINGRVTYRHEWGWISDICAPMDTKGSTLLISLCWYPSELEDTPVELSTQGLGRGFDQASPLVPARPGPQLDIPTSVSDTSDAEARQRAEEGTENRPFFMPTNHEQEPTHRIEEPRNESSSLQQNIGRQAALRVRRESRKKRDNRTQSMDMEGEKARPRKKSSRLAAMVRVRRRGCRQFDFVGFGNLIREISLLIFMK